NNKKLNLIILGVKEANIYYKKLAKEFNINILSLKKSEYEIIELAVIASINGELQDLKRIRKLLQDIIIQPRKEKYENIVVIEACTDFTFGIGKNSLTCFADVMVRECYFNSVIL
ncbi:MAG TPA: hypothetical protein VK590_00700, partial [Saprospiraceae bacterium]|nr:hypothetical protein [Saprospiraceae bacterium]